jgi:hypothetical protein
VWTLESTLHAMSIIVMFGPCDASPLQRAAPDVFDHAISTEWAEEFLDDPRRYLPFAVHADHGVIGFASVVQGSQ